MPPSDVLSADAEHLLKKELIARQLRQEIVALQDHPLTVGALLGTNLPASVDPSLIPDAAKFPLLSPLFNRLLVAFPPFAAVTDGPNQFWVNAGKFVRLFAAVDSGGTSRQTARRDLLANKMVEKIAAVLGNAIRTTGEMEAGKRKSLDASKAFTDVKRGDEWVLGDVEIVDTRVYKRKKLLSSTEVLEYIISSNLNGREVVVVRDYVAFKALHKELIRRPNMAVPPLPALADCPPEGPPRELACQSLRKYLVSLTTQPISSSLRDFLGQSEPVDREPSQEEAAIRAEQITQALELFKTELITPGGMTELFKKISAADDIADLPAHYHFVVEWWRICAAAALQQTFVDHVRAPEHLRRLKMFHTRASYGTWAAILKGTNPVTIFNVIVKLLLARPFGTHCLLQNAIANAIDDEAHAILEEIAQMEKVLGNDRDLAMRAWLIVQNAPLGGYDEDPPRDFVTEVLGFTPEKESLQRDAAEKLLELHWRVRRMKQLHDLVMQDATVDFAKDLLAISYKPLAEAYRAADPGHFVRDFAKFIEDLIAVVEKEQAKAFAQKAQNTTASEPPALRPFAGLIARHQHRIYKLIRGAISTSPGKVAALNDIATWMDDVAKFFRGYGPAVDLKSLVDANITDEAALSRDLEKLRKHKEARRARAADRVMRRVRGEAKGSSVMDELNAELGEDSGMGRTDAQLQQLWMEKMREEEARDKEGGSLPPRSNPMPIAAPASGSSSGNMLQVPETRGLPRVRSYGDLGSSPNLLENLLDGNDKELTEEELEKRLLNLVIDEEEDAAPQETPTVQGDTGGGEAPVNSPGIPYTGVNKRNREWKDPLGLESVEKLGPGWVAALGAWLNAVKEGGPTE
ncbi:hypothetical protein HK104_009984 [Borealophlyctis nickersoniae]|nr:hypothetical protein HK104_009984 [Borealophlyctis nickersoniae]